MVAGSIERRENGYRCAACGNTASFRALKPYWHKVVIDAFGMVLEDHGIDADEDGMEDVECSQCGVSVSLSANDLDAPARWPSRYRCLTCGNESEFHRFYVEEAKERLREDGEWEILEAWEFADGGETTFGAICSPCDAADRDSDVEEIYPAGTDTKTDTDLETNIEED